MHQLIIIGAGPAGLSSAIFAKRYGLKYIIIGKLPGGTVHEGHKVDNYLGFKSIKGPDLAKEFVAHVPDKIAEEQVESICRQDKLFEVKTETNTYQGQVLILALGMKSRKLGFKNEEKFLNKGIAYYTPTDLVDLKDKTLAVVGGGDSALCAALKVADWAKKVYLIHRRDEFRGAPALVDQAKTKANIELILSAWPEEAKGDNKLTSVVLNTGQELEIDAMFLEVGGVPNVYLCGELGIAMDNNFIKVDKHQSTNVPGIYAAGDMTDNPLKQIITAAAEGAIAATGVYNYLKNSE
ncbi:NAD(P)/FAD-dependent oxidoreductase [Patescibacteria group bacterium]|nr:NAD(P)/FAD-dependent oxidoreductase [Patescibacteria group bacterium]